jgi:hypothetical protein
MRYFCLFLISSCALWAQDAALVSGTVLDPANAAVAGAKVKLTDSARNANRETTTSQTGDYSFDHLLPGSYAIEVTKEGFKTLKLERVEVQARDRQSLVLRLEVGPLTSSVNVEDSVAGITADVSSGSAVDQDYLRHLPVNGRSIDSLVKMAPGVVAGAGAGGGFNVNGLRSNVNYYTLDGLSLNGITGPMGGLGMMGGPRGGGMGMMGGTGGGATDLGTGAISLDSVSQVRIQTQSFAPEFGRTPGAQIALISRSGSNQWHGSIYEYYRGTRFNANEWFANAAGFPRGTMRQNQFGATLGGPLIKDRTFFFATYEGLRLLDPETATAIVPNAAVRTTAPVSLRPYLNAFPLPNGPALSGGAAQFATVFSNPLNNDSVSLRLDHTITARHTAFVRFLYAPSDTTNRSSQVLTPNVVTTSDNKTWAATAALSSALNPNAMNDLRVNYTQSKSFSQSSMDTFGGAVPLQDSQVFPSGVDSARGAFSLSMIGLSGYSFGQGTENRQRQINVVDSLTMTAGSNTYKAGLDVRLIDPTYQRTPYSVNATFRGLTDIVNGVETDGAFLSGKALNATVNSNTGTVYPAFKNFSLYVQDMARLGPATTITFGFRWEINPAPTVRSGPRPLALSSAFDGRVTQNEPLYDTRWRDLAPRFGMTQALKSKPGRDLLLRIGLGAFHDMGYGTVVSMYSGAPYSNVRTLSLPAFPLIRDNLLPPVLPPVKPYGQVSVADRLLQAPIVYQWNVGLEQHLEGGQIISAAYVGTRGRRLMLNSTSFYGGTDYDILMLASNGAESDYHGLQMQYQRRLSRRLQTQFAWTWSHSIDTSSSDAGAGFASLFGGSERGNSNYDVRHLINWSGSYLMPAPKLAVAGILLRDWHLDWMATRRTGLPFQVQGVSATTSNSDSTSTSRGLFAQIRPDYNGQDSWISDPFAPGGRKVNSAAFTTPASFTQGNLGRNALSGFSATQVDFSLRRQIPVTDALRLNFAVQAFNVTNTPSFLNPTRDEGANLASPKFGMATRTLGTGFGGGAGSFYRSGGPRSIQFSVRLQF